MFGKLILKNSRLVTFGANLAKFRLKFDIIARIGPRTVCCPQFQFLAQWSLKPLFAKPKICMERVSYAISQ